ncbi:Aste57867_12290 [Aphanomyces stellatus]|uniref:Aste57867_12290 protein n=1 Tax=Aphanomyces stellatus TaxID=120398 RepID=A0A485KVM2_9STRA|nr:hypothetical protein As57867_012245 [Aphanomyces stellatus]VFT89143.1 Aste57867_12290 [Aphanomyces stellatus]
MNSPQIGRPAGGGRRRKLALVVGAIMCCGAIMASVGAYFVYAKVRNNASQILALIQQTPGLRVTVQSKRESMQFNGQTSAVVYLFPKTNATTHELTFDAFVAQATAENVVHHFTLLDNRAYWTTVAANDSSVVVDATCLGAMPPFRLANLANARVVDQVDTTDTAIDTTCPAAQLLQLSFAGETFVLCNAPTSNQLTKAVGQDVDLTIEYISDAHALPVLAVPTSVDGHLMDCPVLPSIADDGASSSSSSLASDVSLVLAGAPRVASLVAAPACSSCVHGVKPCVFVHGVGSTGGPTTSTFESYWGQIHTLLPCCSSFHFAHLELVTERWDSPTVQRAFCNVALRVSNATNASTTIGDVTILAHSMGNLVVGGALANNVCAMSEATTWFSLAGPMAGSKSANLLADKCHDGSWLKKPLELLGRCPVSGSFGSLVAESTVGPVMQATFNAAQAMRQRYVTRTLCGTNPVGLVSAYSVQTVLVGLLSHHDSPQHDGVVDILSCSAGLNGVEFGTSVESPNYAGQLNHADCSFRYGDGWWGNGRKPIKWLQCAM